MAAKNLQRYASRRAWSAKRTRSCPACARAVWVALRVTPERSARPALRARSFHALRCAHTRPSERR